MQGRAAFQAARPAGVDVVSPFDVAAVSLPAVQRPAFGFFLPSQAGQSLRNRRCSMSKNQTAHEHAGCDSIHPFRNPIKWVALVTPAFRLRILNHPRERGTRRQDAGATMTDRLCARMGSIENFEKL